MIKKLLAVSIIFCALASVSYGAGEPERGYISLHGSASREVSPNIAEISFTVENTHKDVKTAIADNNKVASAVVSAVKSKLTKDKDVIKTGRISVNPNYTYSKDGKRSLKDYTVNNTVIIRTEQVDNISSIVDAALSSGANRMNNLNFMFTEDKKVCSELYPEILNDLKKQAGVMAGAFGSTVAGIKYMNANCGKQYSTMYRNAPMMSAKAYAVNDSASGEEAMPSTPIEAGKVKVDANIEVQVFVK